MQANDIFNLSGLIFNIIGSILLAVSLSKFLTSLHGTAAIHDMQIQSLINRHDRVLAGDVGNLLKLGSQNGRLRTTWGLTLLIIGFMLQLLPYILMIKSYFAIKLK